MGKFLTYLVLCDELYFLFVLPAGVLVRQDEFRDERLLVCHPARRWF